MKRSYAVSSASVTVTIANKTPISSYFYITVIILVSFPAVIAPGGMRMFLTRALLIVFADRLKFAA